MSNIPLQTVAQRSVGLPYKISMPKIYFILLLASLLCSTSRGDVNIVTTIKPLQMIAEAVVQENGDVSSIVNAQQSPHHFTVSPSDRIALAEADVAVWIGPLLETHISDFFSQNQVKTKSITVLDIPKLELHTLEEGQLDAHLWLNSLNAIRIADAIAERAAELDPINAALYRQNSEKFSLAIESKNQSIAEKFQSPANLSYAVYHNAYQYFEQQFGLQHAVVMLQDPEIQPGIRQIVQMRNEVREKQPACLLMEFDSSAELANTVLDGHELNRITVDLLGADVTISKDAYSQFLDNIADDFVRCIYD